MEEQIARFMLRAAKFEFYLVNKELALAQTRTVGSLEVIAGVQWSQVAKRLEDKVPFNNFDFGASPFDMFKRTAPQFLVKGDGQLRWDSDTDPINSWERLLTRSYGQLRNNIAHGNKAQVTAPFAHDRTADFLKAGHVLLDFLAETLFDEPDWEIPIAFR